MRSIRTATILTALIVVLGFARDAVGYNPDDRFYPDYTIRIGGQRFGFGRPGGKRDGRKGPRQSREPRW